MFNYMFRPGYIQPMHGIVSKTKFDRSMVVERHNALPCRYSFAPSNFPFESVNPLEMSSAQVWFRMSSASSTLVESQ